VAVDKNTGRYALGANGDITEKVAPELKHMANKLVWEQKLNVITYLVIVPNFMLLMI
jgi:hypothetical protein